MSSSPRRTRASVSSARACCAVMAIVVTVLSDCAAVFFALRLSAVEMTSAVPTQTTIISTASPPATKPTLIRRRVRRVSQRLANNPNRMVANTTMMTEAGIRAEAAVSASTRAEVASYSRWASGRIWVCISAEASDR